MLMLTPSDVQSECWTRMKKQFETQLTEWRGRLENPNIEERERLALCWKIDTVKQILMAETLVRKNVAGAGE